MKCTENMYNWQYLCEWLCGNSSSWIAQVYNSLIGDQSTISCFWLVGYKHSWKNDQWKANNFRLVSKMCFNISLNYITTFKCYFNNIEGNMKHQTNNKHHNIFSLVFKWQHHKKYILLVLVMGDKSANQLQNTTHLNLNSTVICL